MLPVKQHPRSVAFRHNQVHREYFADAGEEYLFPPVCDLDNIDQITTDNAYETVTEIYFGKMSQETRNRINSLVEELSSNDDHEPIEDPEMIVCIPVAAHNEDPHTLQTTFDVLAQQQNANKTELLIFGNYPDSIGDDAELAAHENIHQSVEQARHKHPELNIRYVTAAFEEETMGMGAVRKDMMDMVVADALVRGRNYQQPVVWIDADLTRMNTNALAAMNQKIKFGGSHFVHLRTRQTIENLTGVASLDSLSLEERIAAHYEITRRRASRAENIPYPEESGLGFMLGSYVLVGGVNSRDPANEAMHMLRTYAGTTGQMYSYKAEEIIKKISNRSMSKYPASLLEYMPEAVYTSGRRLVAAAKRLIEETSAGAHQGFDIGNAYNTFSHTESLRGKSQNNIGTKSGDQGIYDAAVMKHADILSAPRRPGKLNRLRPTQ